MAWDDTKQEAGDPSNPSGIEQLTASEWNAMVSDQKDRVSSIEIQDDGSVVVNTELINFTTELDVQDDGNGNAVVSLADALNLTDLVSSTITAQQSLTASSSFTDPAGIEHTGELADIEDASGQSTIAPPGVEIEDASSVAMGVPVTDGDTLSVYEWGIRTSEDTTPAGLTLQLVDSAETVIAEQNTSYTFDPPVSVTNNSGSVSWYYFRFVNDTGSDIILGNTPDAVYGNVAYEVK